MKKKNKYEEWLDEYVEKNILREIYIDYELAEYRTIRVPFQDGIVHEVAYLIDQINKDEMKKIIKRCEKEDMDVFFEGRFLRFSKYIE